MLVRLSLILDDAVQIAQLKYLLRDEDVIIESIDSNGEQLQDQLRRDTSDILIIAERRIPGRPEDFIKNLANNKDQPSLVLLTSRNDQMITARYLACGCEMVLPADLSHSKLVAVLQPIISRRKDLVVQHYIANKSIEEPRLHDFVSKSQVMHDFMKVVQRMLKSDASLLILGETGVGKGRLAKAIHNESKRASGPFISVNCGAFSENLLESELFGHERGSFTGAIRSRRGCFELAHSGTLFLDEVGDMPTHLQVKLLRVIQEKEVQRIGSEKPFKIDVRLVTATNRNLFKEVENLHFRKDLFYRLGVVIITMPPLRERKEDLAVLTTNFIQHFRLKFATEVDSITDAALDVFRRYSWPGNIRELMNIIERAMLLANSSSIDLLDLPEEMLKEAEVELPRKFVDRHDEFLFDNKYIIGKSWEDARRDILDRFEQYYFASLLRENRGRISRSARMAGIRPRSLYDKMKKYGLRKETFKQDNCQLSSP